MLISVNANGFREGDCAPYHMAYIALVADADIPSLLPAQREQLAKTIGAIPESMGDTTYAPGKWTIREVMQHVNDTERIFAFRLLALSRGEQQQIPGFEQDEYAQMADVSSRTLADLIAEFVSIRNATITLIDSLPNEALQRRGMVSGFPVLAATLPFILTGHVAHHLGVLQDRYGINLY